ncbi:hypothetical protein FACS189418_6840 [Clostridia bacterium]|nr:hypothetical protein FACS189418_6840 [Clostridia bacterium]
MKVSLNRFLKMNKQVHTLLDGKLQNVLFRPGQSYQLPEDERFMKYLKSQADKYPFTQTLVDELERLGVKHTIELCKSCLGRRKMIFIPTFVFEEEKEG